MYSKSAGFLMTMGYIIIAVGVIGSIILGVNTGNAFRNGGIGFGVFLGGAISSLVMGFVLVALGEIAENTAITNSSLTMLQMELKEIEKKLADNQNVVVAAPVSSVRNDQEGQNTQNIQNTPYIQVAKVNTDPNKKVCSNCGALMSKRAKFCENCKEWDF